MLEAIGRLRRRAFGEQEVRFGQSLQCRMQRRLIHLGDVAQQQVGEISPKHRPDLRRFARGAEPIAIVRIKGGPLDDRIGMCTGVSANTVTVLLSMFGSERKVRFSRTAVEA
jgi:hypothetical protein